MSLADVEVGGSENLEVMAEARNYNAFLVAQVEHAMAGRRRILDFGAGRGAFAATLQKNGHNVVCVEPEPRLQRELRNLGLEAHLSLGEIPPQSLDGIYTLNVLEHIDDDEAVLAQFYEKLVSGGALYIYVPAFQMLYSAMDRRVGHVRRYLRGELIAKCRRANFTVEAAGYCDSLGFPATIVYKLMGDDNGSINLRALIAYDRAVFPISRLLDTAMSRVLGKNVWLRAVRP